MKSISIKNVSKSFGAVKVVKDVSLEVTPGEFVVFLGPSGCGKSTLLRLIAGLETAESGALFLGDKDITNAEAADRNLAMVFQSYALYPHMTVKKNIAYPLTIRKTPVAQIDIEVDRVAEKLGLKPYLARKPRELSGGQRQRVALARAMVRRPQAFLMDEPLSNLDAGLRVQMRAELKHLHRELGATTLYVTHDQTEAMTLAQRIAVMNDGKILQFDTPKNIYRKPANIFVARFVGSPAMNFIEGTCSAGVFENGFFQLKIAGAPGAGPLTLGFRSEDIELSREAKPGFVQAKVFVTEELGHENLIILDGGNGNRITARAPSHFLADDSRVWFSLSSNKSHALHFFDSEMGTRIESDGEVSEGKGEPHEKNDRAPSHPVDRTITRDLRGRRPDAVGAEQRPENSHR